ncbi:hypothetical protein FHR32_007708 [Streptosporangium album]|uniref:Uncharacterized protein n=1 Tax=Streptosporangium album TaxID=47479 RepID=A0A7W7S3Q7_9ACTN|nr:hypothetical protein [Streptosporangium album]MBB4943308.1 hypothetical protein [Streptosporangium album]
MIVASRVEWLASGICPMALTDEGIRVAVLSRCRNPKVEPPGRAERIVRGCRARFERAFCEQVTGCLSADATAALLELVTGADGFSAELKSDPVRLTLLAALAWCRTAEITDALVDLLGRYADVPGKIRHHDGVDAVPITGVVPEGWLEAVVDGDGVVERVSYELCVLAAGEERAAPPGDLRGRRRPLAQPRRGPAGRLRGQLKTPENLRACTPRSRPGGASSICWTSSRSPTSSRSSPMTSPPPP